jgi:hypothetical protein
VVEPLLTPEQLQVLENLQLLENLPGWVALSL